MSEMSERVTKAIRDELINIGYGVGTINAGQLSDALSRVAIEAMREPTQKMRLAGIVEWSRPDPTPEHHSTLVFNAVWRAMVDAALTSNTAEPA